MGVINVKCKASLMGLKPVLSFLKQMALIAHSLEFYTRLLTATRPPAFYTTEINYVLVLIIYLVRGPNLPAACKHAPSCPISECQGTVHGQFRSLLSLLSLCHCHGQKNHEIAQGSQWGTLFSVAQRKSFVTTQLKSYPVKIESNISSSHPLSQRQTSRLMFGILLPPLTRSLSPPIPPPSHTASTSLLVC